MKQPNGCTSTKGVTAMAAFMGKKVSIRMPWGEVIPSIVTSDDPDVEITTVINKRTQQPVDINVVRYDVVSLRKPLEGEPYLKITSEVEHYGFAPKFMPRTGAAAEIVGLDVDAEGNALPLQTVLDTEAAANQAFFEGLYAARNEVELA